MEMCSVIGVNLQRGMNFRLRDAESVILMSLRPGAPYADQVEDEGRVLIYEGHDIAKTLNGPPPKQVDQPERNPGGSLTQNGRFAKAVRKYKDGTAPPERVRVYEKIRSGIWVRVAPEEPVRDPLFGSKASRFRDRTHYRVAQHRAAIARPSS